MRKQEYRDQKALQWLHHVRNEELKAATSFFPSDKKTRILEIGGGEGYVAKCICDMGYGVTSIDIAPIFPQLYPVLEVDASRLNFRSETFDVVFSCQVLQHIKDLELTFQEIKRVLKKDGIIIHTVPTTWWRLITCSAIPLGTTSPTSIHEIYYFSKFFWNKLFKRNGFQIICVENGPYLYSGYLIFKMRFLKFRKFMAKYFSASYCYVLKK